MHKLREDPLLEPEDRVVLAVGLDSFLPRALNHADHQLRYWYPPDSFWTTSHQSFGRSSSSAIPGPPPPLLGDVFNTPPEITSELLYSPIVTLSAANGLIRELASGFGPIAKDC